MAHLPDAGCQHVQGGVIQEPSGRTAASILARLHAAQQQRTIPGCLLAALTADRSICAAVSQ